MRPKANFIEEVYGVSTQRDPSTQVVTMECWSAEAHHGNFHRVGGPALTWRDAQTGVAVLEEWHLNGKLHREDGPAIIRRTPDGKVKSTQWFHHGELIPYRKRPRERLARSAPHP